MLTKKTRFILGGVMLLFMVGFYAVFFISIDASVSDLIPFWPMFLSLAVAIVAISIGFWHMPEQHRTPAIAAIALTGLLLRELTIHTLTSWYLPMFATAVVIIICVAVFLPVRNDVPVGVVMMRKVRVILGGVMLLFMVGFYAVFFISIDASVSDLIPFWPMFLSLAVAIVAISIGFWYMPEQHRTHTIAAIAMTGLLLRELTIHTLSSWYPPMFATAVVIIICVVVFLPVNSTANRPTHLGETS